MDVQQACEALAALSGLGLFGLMVGISAGLPDVQRLIEQQRFQRQREAEFLRKHPRLEIEA